MESNPYPLVDVDRLQVGVHIVLDRAWQAHPFLRSRFTLRRVEQIEQLRAAGIVQVRYCRERSERPPLAASAAKAADSIAPAPLLASQPRRDQAAVAKPSAAPADPGSVLAQQHYQTALGLHQQLLKQAQSDPDGAAHTARRAGHLLLASIVGRPAPALALLPSTQEGPQAGHEVCTAILAVLLGKTCGFTAEALLDLALAGLCHDIGKLHLPAFLHEDDGRLSEDERHSYRQHVERGVVMASSMGLSLPVRRAIAEHHEHQDGSGFPRGLGADQLSLAGAVLAISNRYMNLVRPQRFDSGLTPHQALRQIFQREAGHYAPVVLARLVRLLGIYPPGSLVELSDHRMAVVVASRPGHSRAARVQPIEHPDDELGGASIEIAEVGDLQVRCSVPPTLLNPRWARRARQLARSAFFAADAEPAMARRDLQALPLGSH